MTAKQVFDGTPSTVIALTASIADAGFTVNSTNATITEFDNSSDLWPAVVLRLELPDTFGAAPDDGSSIDVFMTTSDQGGTDDPTPPTTTTQEAARWVGAFRIYDTDEAQYPSEIIVPLIGVRQCKFFLQNNTGQTLSYSTGGTLTAEGCSLQDV